MALKLVIIIRNNPPQLFLGPLPIHFTINIRT